jgi:hypothetical protein
MSSLEKEMNVVASAMVKIPPETHAKLQELARSQHRPMGEIVTELVDRYEREKFWNEVDISLARLQADPVAWNSYQDEIRLLEGGSLDGLAQEPPYFTPEEIEALLADETNTADR